MNLALFLALVMLPASGAIAVAVHRIATRTAVEAATGWLEDTMHRRIYVHTLDGMTLVGQLVRVDADGLVLDAVELEGQTALAGSVFVARDRIAFTQHPTV